MKNQELKQILDRFNSLQLNKSGNLEILNQDEIGAIKGGTTEIDCEGRFKIKCQQNFTIKEES
ncbi:hypothetical protein SAMN05421827_12547 [Pedobacter terrae]|uniref:Uncharacterized protein n=1 Tax=Pedobacter terrae TaxID=405671 RepID=A0A1G8CMD6_9SPHI|nr:hypothetical protein [Pedobacter terrae]SDH46459.1 hypothetical protein SAMN05421827_12547 [Pedobacter terrae]